MNKYECLQAYANTHQIRFAIRWSATFVGYGRDREGGYQDQSGCHQAGGLQIAPSNHGHQLDHAGGTQLSHIIYLYAPNIELVE